MLSLNDDCPAETIVAILLTLSFIEAAERTIARSLPLPMLQSLFQEEHSALRLF